MLDDLDWELDRRGHQFVRYADDGRIYVRSRRAGERVMASITQYVEQRLKLKVNREKSVVARALRRPFLGFCFLPRMGEVRVLVDPKALKRAKDRLRALTSRRWGVSMERRIDEINRFTVGWTAYFRLADTPTVFEELDQWLRRRLRQVRWKEWNASPHTATQPASAGYLRDDRPSMGVLAEGVLAHRRLQSPRRRPAQRLLDRSRPAGIPRPLPPFPGMLSEPPDADPHVRWCGGRRGEPGAYPIHPIGAGISARPCRDETLAANNALRLPETLD